MDNIETPKDMAKVAKALQRKVRKDIGLLRRPDGHLAVTPEESLDILCDTHFYKSKKLDENDTTYIDKMKRKIGDFTPKKSKFRTEARIKKAIDLFNNDKAPGLDEIPPRILKALGQNSLAVIQKLFDASIQTGYTPEIWRSSKVVFIPKPSKDDYAMAKSFRPISLTPFLFKTLERLCYWQTL